MSLKSKFLHFLMRSGKKQFQEIISSFDPAHPDLRKEIKKAEKARANLVVFGKLVAMMSKSIADIPVEEVTMAGVRTFMMTPANPSDTLILYLHGGAFILGIAQSHRIFTANLARETGATVCLIDYRLAPENPFPAGLDDIYAVYKSFLDQQHNPKKIVIMGDSAGGNLTLALLLKIKQEGLLMPAAAVPISPLTDFHMTAETFTTKADADCVLPVDETRLTQYAYLRGESPTNPLASPLLGDLKGLPPLMILVGTKEILLHDSINFADKARRAGVDVTLDIHDELFHVYPLFVDILEDARIALGKIVLFVKLKTA